MTTPEERANIISLMAKASNALSYNDNKRTQIQNWLDNGPFNNAGVSQAVQDLAADMIIVHKQLNALIRLLVGMYGDHEKLVDGSDT